jgi:hypothetical protein
MVTTKMIQSQWPGRPRRAIVLGPFTHTRSRALKFVAAALIAGGGALGCGPKAAIPAVPAPQSIGAVGGRTAHLAVSLAPVLYVHKDEWFPLARAVAIVHPSRRVIAYHMLWRDDVFGAWIPRTVPTDEEIVWVGYDSTWAPTEVWTYWHGTILHTKWPKQQVAIDVQWGKHGSLPRGMRLGDLPRYQSLNSFYVVQTLMVWDFWLGNVTRKGPWCFCRGYGRYRAFDTPVLLADHLNAVVVAEDPRNALRAVFGARYSEKPPWPWKLDLLKAKEIS